MLPLINIFRVLQNVIDAVNSLDKDQWNEANQIELGNGAYESEDQGIRNVEDALQGLSDQFGLTKEQATALLPALEALGVVNIDPNVDMTGIDELDQATQDGMASLRQMKADGDIDLSFEIDSDTDGLSIDELQSQIDELEKAKVKLKLDVDSPEYNAIQSMIDQRETQIHLQVLMDQSTDIDKWLALANGEDGDKQLAIAAGIDLNDEDAQSKIDIENLKKGDIIFSTTQTDALLKHGAIQGHARAYASGTVTSPGVMKAYAAAGNTPGFHFQGGAATVKPAGSGNSGNSGNSGLQHAIEDNTDAVSNNSDDTSDAALLILKYMKEVKKCYNLNLMVILLMNMD